MSSTQTLNEGDINNGGGGIWSVTVPDGVTVTPTTDNTGVVTALDINIDYTAADVKNPDGKVELTFTGPSGSGNAGPNQAFPGLRNNTTIEVKNDSGQTITNYAFVLKNQNVSPNPDTGNPHPDDYAHVHNLTQAPGASSVTGPLVDAGSGQPNATLTLLDPLGGPASSDGPGTGGPAASTIKATGTIDPGATEKLIGINPGNSFTLHSEDTPGPAGGSFTLDFTPEKVSGGGNTNPVTHTIAAGQFFDVPGTDPNTNAPLNEDDSYVFAGAGLGGPAQLHFLGPDAHKIGSVTVAGDSKNNTVRLDSDLTVKNGVQMKDGGQLNFELGKNNLILQGDSIVDNGGRLGLLGGQSNPNVVVNGTIKLGANGTNQLTSVDTTLLDGTLKLEGQSDTADVGDASGFTFNVQAGKVNLLHGVTGQDFFTLGDQGEIDIFKVGQVTKADFDSQTHVLTLRDNNNNSLSTLTFNNNTSLSLSTGSNAFGDFIAVTNHGGGNLPLHTVL